MKSLSRFLARTALLGLGVMALWSVLAVPQRAYPAPTAATTAGNVSTVATTPEVSVQTLQAVANAAKVDVHDVHASPVAGIFEIRQGASILYTTEDGQYVFTGDLYAVKTHENLTEAHRRVLRKTLIDAVPESQMVVFSPPDPKYTVTVFTDVDCGYCRALHRQIADYNRLGVRVRYVFFPRTGPNTESWFKAEQVWCSPDRKAALTRAKLGEPLDAKPCPNTPVEREWELGRSIGLDGTPGVIAADGSMVGGYLPPDQLVAQLKQLQP